MQSITNITTLFLDIGEVLLTNRSGHESRQLATEKFNLDFNDFDTRHTIAFETYEIGKLTMAPKTNGKKPGTSESVLAIWLACSNCRKYEEVKKSKLTC